MKFFSRTARRRGIASAAVLAAVAGGLLAGGTAQAAVVPGATPHQITVSPTVVPAGARTAAAVFGCQSRPIDGSQGARCYSPQQIQAGYGLTPLLQRGVTGKGRTIVIVDAYSDPYLANDLAVFSSTFGLPAGQFTTIAPYGVPAFDIKDENAVGWAEEMTLDVLWAHAIAPGAKIVLAEAASSNDDDILATTQYVIDHNLGDVISQSFGEAETCVDPKIEAAQHAAFVEATAKKITLIASSGDSGASQPACDPNSTAALFEPSSPATDPNVLGVGGTTLNLDANGKYLGETAWDEFLYGCNPPAVAATDEHCSGGGYSSIYSRPSYQAGVPNTKAASRGVPDVAYNAGSNGGVLTQCGVCAASLGLDPSAPAFFIFGGTSAGSPQWAGLIADADQLGGKRAGLVQPTLYAASKVKAVYSNAFHDITTGSNVITEIGGQGYQTKTNWDAVTGLGTPKATVLLPLIAAASHL